MRHIGTGQPGSGNGQFCSLRGVAVDAHCVYVADQNNNRVQVFKLKDGGHLVYFRTIGGMTKSHRINALGHPGSVCVDTGHLYVADSRNNRILVFLKI